MEYVQIVEEEGDEPMELPTENDGTLLQTTLQAQYPGSCGLKYRSEESSAARGVRLSEGRFYPPTDDGWGDQIYFCVFPKENKRKGDTLESSPAKKRAASKCTDLIVLGLPWKTTEGDLREHFEQYGDVAMVQLKKNPNSGQSKGFGFIRFSDISAQRSALATRHSFDGRMCEVKIPNSKQGLISQASNKIFVGRCTENMTTEDLREYFSKFGEVTDVYIPKPFRSFSFVTFVDPDVAQSLCGDDHIIKGASVNISTAAPKQPRNNNNGNDGGNNFNRNNNGYGNNMNGYGGGNNGRGNSYNDRNMGNNMSNGRGNQGYNNSRSGGWNDQNLGNNDIPNLKNLGLNLQGSNSSNPAQNNPLGAIVAAALGQFIGNLQNPLD